MKVLNKMTTKIAIEKSLNDDILIFDKLIDKWKQVSSYYQVEWNNNFIQWEVPKNLTFDFAITLAFSISRLSNKNAYDIAAEIKENFLHLFQNEIEIFVNKDGYLNCTFSDNFYKNSLNKFNFDNFYFEKKNISINVEFVSVNPTGYLHLGHLRNAVIGDTLANIYNFVGYDVVREYYINDRGNQIKELVNSVLFSYAKRKRIELVGIKEENLSYKGKSIEDASLYILENNLISDDPNNWKFEEIEDIVVQFFIKKIKLDLASCGISFDQWFSEKRMYQNPDEISLILKDIHLKNLSYRKEGALFLKTSLFNDDKDRVIIKENGEYTYFFSDILYHLNKLKRSDVLVNVWGSDHHGYISRLISSLSLLGQNVENKFYIVLIQMVSLLTNEGSKKFSKRLGNSIGLEETLNILKKDQLRFCLLEKESNHTLLIDLETLNQHSENSRLYYIQ